MAKVLERLPLTFLPQASQPAGLNHLSSAQFSHKKVLLWVIRLGSDVENDPTYEIARLKEDYSSIEDKPSGDQLRQLTNTWFVEACGRDE